MWIAHLQHCKIQWKMAATKSTITTRAMKPSVWRTATSSQTTTSGTWTPTSTWTNTTPMTMLTSTIAWCITVRWACTQSALIHTRDVISHLIGSSPEQTLCHPRSWSWRVLFDSTSPFFLHFSFLSFSVCFLHNELFQARQPDHHGKLVPLRRRKEWRHPERLLHRFWAQPPDLRRAQRFIGPLLLHDPFHGPGRGWRDTRQDAHKGTPGMSVSQSVVVVCKVRWIRNLMEKKCRSISKFRCHKFFWRHSNCKNGRWIRATWWAQQLERTD